MLKFKVTTGRHFYHRADPMEKNGGISLQPLPDGWGGALIGATGIIHVYYKPLKSCVFRYFRHNGVGSSCRNSSSLVVSCPSDFPDVWSNVVALNADYVLRPGSLRIVKCPDSKHAELRGA